MADTPWTVDTEPALPSEPLPEQAAPPPVSRLVEALLFVGGAPLTLLKARTTLRGLTEEQFSEILDTLNRDYRKQGRPYQIQPQGDGHVLALRPRYRTVLERLHGGTREARLSPQAVDVLALVAYRQPTTKQEVESIRGAESGALLRQLVRRGLITMVERMTAETREVAYGTTRRFLEIFGLTSLDELPQTHDLQQL